LICRNLRCDFRSKVIHLFRGILAAFSCIGTADAFVPLFLLFYDVPQCQTDDDDQGQRSDHSCEIHISTPFCGKCRFSMLCGTLCNVCCCLRVQVVLLVEVCMDLSGDHDDYEDHHENRDGSGNKSCCEVTCCDQCTDLVG